MKHDLYELCASAHRNTSFSPERRAESELRYYDGQLLKFRELCGGDSEQYEDIKRKFTAKFSNHMSAKSRCMSSMITGPANFPVRRAEKANASERKRGDELMDFVDRVVKNFDKKKNPHRYGISSDHVDALQLLKDKLISLERNQVLMKDANKILKNKKTTLEEKVAELKNKGLSQEGIHVCLAQGGFASFSLSNNNATIKTAKGRIAELEAKKNAVTREKTIKGVRVVENTEDNRIQLFFNGKPEPEVRALAKRCGMRWSPSVKCWQRMLNTNGKYAVYHLFFNDYEEVA